MDPAGRFVAPCSIVPITIGPGSPFIPVGPVSPVGPSISPIFDHSDPVHIYNSFVSATIYASPVIALIPNKLLKVSTLSFKLKDVPTGRPPIVVFTGKSIEPLAFTSLTYNV